MGPSPRVGLKSNLKATGYPHDTHIANAQQAYFVKSFITVACNIHSWANLLTMSLLAALVAPSSTIKAIQKGGSFCIGTSMTFPCPVTKGCSILKRACQQVLIDNLEQ